MNEKKRIYGRPFIKGDPRAGRPKMPLEWHLTQQLTQADFKTLMVRFMGMTTEEVKNFKGTIFEEALAKILLNARNFGDPTKLEFFVNRLFGKVPDKVEYTETDELRNLNDEELFEKMKDAMEGFKQKLLGENK